MHGKGILGQYFKSSQLSFGLDVCNFSKIFEESSLNEIRLECKNTKKKFDKENLLTKFFCKKNLQKKFLHKKSTKI